MKKKSGAVHPLAIKGRRNREKGVTYGWKNNIDYVGSTWPRQ
jgi:hypothetical protein